MAGLQLSGLSSGIDWKSIVDQLMSVEQTPITRMQTEKATNDKRSSALSTLENKFTALQTAASGLASSGLYSRRTATFAGTTTWTSTASDGADAGTYTFNVTQLATSSSLKGASNIGKAIASDGNLAGLTVGTLPISTAVTAGNFTVNGKKITIATSDSFQAVLDRINSATNGDVTAAYNASTDKVELTAASGKTIVLGATNDTSNFLKAMRLSNADNATSLASASSLGTVSTSDTLASARFTTPLSQTGAFDGSFSINGTQIDYNTGTDTLASLISKINASDAGVTASYDTTNDRISLTNTKTGDTGFALEDTSGNMLEALGLTSASATTTRGKDAIFTLNGGGTLVSSSNTLGSDVTGINGLSVTATTEGSQTVTVAASTADAKTAIDAFISKYNDVQDYIDEQTKTTTTSDGKVTTSTLTSNREVQSWAHKLRTLAFEAFSGNVTRLNDLGIDFTSGTDKLEIKDSTKLSSALSDQSSAVAAYFTTKTTGFADRFKSYIDSTIGTDGSSGAIGKQTDSLNNSNADLDKQIADLNRRLTQQRSILESSFIAMEQAQSKSNNILSQLTKSFG